MNNWEKTTLGDLISIKGGFSYKGNHIGTGSSLLLGMGCVSFEEKFLVIGARPYAGECPDAYLVNPGDIVLATRQQSDNLPILGMPAIIPNSYKGKRLIAGTNLYMVKNKSDVDNRFLFWLLRTPAYINHIFSSSKGTTVRMITKDAVETFRFFCPPKSERKPITDILTSLDNKIDLLHRQNETLEALAETLFRQWFIEKADESWEELMLRDVITIKGGFSYKGEFIGSGEAVLLGMGCVSFNKRFLQSGARSYSGVCPDNYLVEPGDLVIATRQQSDNLPILGNPAIVPQELAGRDVIVGANLYRVVNNSNLHNYVIYLLLKSFPYRNHIIASSKGTTVRMITKDAIEAFHFRMPPKETVDEFQSIIKPINEKIDKISIQIKTLTQLRDTLLPKLMSGEVRVKM